MGTFATTTGTCPTRVPERAHLGFDVAVAHQATYYNPLLDIPFYWLATHTHIRGSRSASCWRFVQGLNVDARSISSRGEAVTPSGSMQDRRRRARTDGRDRRTHRQPLTYTTCWLIDDVMSVFILFELAILVVLARTR